MANIDKIKEILSEEYHRGFKEANYMIDEHDVKIVMQIAYNTMTGEDLPEDVALKMIEAIKKMRSKCLGIILEKRCQARN